MNPNEVVKAAAVKSLTADDTDLALINRQSLKTLTADDVFVFKVAACNNQVDRDFERFTDAALEAAAKLFVSKTLIADHNWSAFMQTARIYDASVEPMPDVAGGKFLQLKVYMLRNEKSQPVIDAIEGGILREVSVSMRCEKAVCSICGADKRKMRCEHWRGTTYGDTKCIVSLDDVTDAYETSFVAVPAQPAAGVIKLYGGEDNDPEPETKRAAFDLKVRIAEANMKIMTESED